jgi:predicted transcriptional regulator
MLTEQEIINNALKKMLMMEDMTAQKFADMAKQITQPNLQNMLKGMEMASRNNSKSISQKMSDMAIV